MAPDADAFGRALMDWTRGGTEPEFLERDDGVMDEGAGHNWYLAPFNRWPLAERQAMRHLRGPVIDVGCAAGRVALYVQQRGHDVVGVDSSRRALRAAQLRGVTETWHAPVEELGTRIADFETIVLFGNNFGIFGTPYRLKRTLAQWAERTPRHTRILAESVNPFCGGAPTLDRRYYQKNKQRGHLPGQVRLRTHYGRWTSPWFRWMFVSRREMRSLLHGTGWRQRSVLGVSRYEPYVAILEKN